jgi:uncharacterized membrane protein
MNIERTLNPEVDHLLASPHVLRELWIAANHQSLLEAAEKAKQIDAQRSASARQFAGGGVGGAGGSISDGGPIPGEAEGWADL